MIACVALVLGFRRSSNLGGAYGVAVSSLMMITTILFYVVIRDYLEVGGQHPASAPAIVGNYS